MPPAAAAAPAATSESPLVLPAAQVPDPATAPALKWGVISPGGIAGKFTDTLHAATASSVVAVVSRSRQRAERFAAERARPGTAMTAYDDVEAMLAAGGVDAVYVASPHAQHRDLALAVVRAGVPVLVEKAFTLSAAQSRHLIEAASARDVFCMEAMWTRFLPQADVLRQILAQGTLGDVVTVRADHGQAFTRDPAHRLYDPALGGGALLDLGVYPVSFAQMVLGDLGEVVARGELTDTGVDAEVGILARGARGGLAVLDATLRARTPTVAVVHGTRGTASLPSPFYAPGTLRVDLLDGRSAQAEHPGDPELGMAYEAAEVARCVADGRRESPIMSWESTLSVMATMDSVRAQLGVRYPGETQPGVEGDADPGADDDR